MELAKLLADASRIASTTVDGAAALPVKVRIDLVDTAGNVTPKWETVDVAQIYLVASGGAGQHVEIPVHTIDPRHGAEQQGALRIFHLSRTDEGSHYGQHTSHVVIAADETHARLIAGRAARSGENGVVWFEPTTQAIELGRADPDETEPRIVLAEYLGE